MVGRIYYACHPERFTSAGFVRQVGRACGRPVRLIGLPEPLARLILRVTGGVAGALGRTTVLTADKAHEFFQPAWTGDPGPLSRDTGWRAAEGLERGLAATAGWYREQGWMPPA